MKLRQGDSNGLRITVVVPPGAPGAVDVTVAHSSRPDSPATFAFTYIDDRTPEAGLPSPRRVYAGLPSTLHP